MSLSEINWKRHLASHSLIPADLEIRVVEGGNIQEWMERNVLRAHKAFLASVSDVFAAQFYGKMAQDEGHVYFENTTMIAARTLLDYIYGKPQELNLGSLSMENLYSLLLLADKFALLDLSGKVKSAIETFRLERSNVMEVAAVAEKYMQVSREISVKLQNRCAEFLATFMKDFTSISAFLLTKVEDFELLKKLLRANFGKVVKGQYTSWKDGLENREDWETKMRLAYCNRLPAKKTKKVGLGQIEVRFGQISTNKLDGGDSQSRP